MRISVAYLGNSINTNVDRLLPARDMLVLQMMSRGSGPKRR